jgi:small subunit ribosomal protein S9
LSTDDTERTPDEETEAAAPAEEAAAAPADDAATAAPAGESEALPSEPAAEPEAAPADDAATAAPEGQSEQPSTPAASTPDASTASEEEPVVEAEAPPEAPAVEAPPAEAPPAEAPAAEAPRAEAPGADAAGGDDEEYEAPTPRLKPEIPGADLEPVFVAEEERYVDAEAQAAAEAEAEAAAERARAEAEDEQSKPIADAAIDLAAGARYTATGKRKTAVARVVLKPGGGEYQINGKTLNAFFPRETLQRMIRQPLEAVGYDARMDVIARMHGGGVSAQAGALRHGISRALIEADPNLRGELKRRGYLTRDPRVKERKKAGLKKARKRPQFSKR